MKPSVYPYVIDCDIKLFLSGSQSNNVETCWPKGECCIFLSSLRQKWVLPPSKPKAGEGRSKRTTQKDEGLLIIWLVISFKGRFPHTSTYCAWESKFRGTGETWEVEKRGQWRSPCRLLVSCVKWTLFHWAQEGWPTAKETPGTKGWESAGRSGVWVEGEDGVAEPDPQSFCPVSSEEVLMWNVGVREPVWGRLPTGHGWPHSLSQRSNSSQERTT